MTCYGDNNEHRIYEIHETDSLISFFVVDALLYSFSLSLLKAMVERKRRRRNGWRKKRRRLLLDNYFSLQNNREAFMARERFSNTRSTDNGEKCEKCRNAALDSDLSEKCARLQRQPVERACRHWKKIGEQKSWRKRRKRIVEDYNRAENNALSPADRVFVYVQHMKDPSGILFKDACAKCTACDGPCFRYDRIRRQFVFPRKSDRSYFQNTSIRRLAALWYRDCCECDGYYISIHRFHATPACFNFLRPDHPVTRLDIFRQLSGFARYTAWEVQENYERKNAGRVNLGIGGEITC